MNQSPRADKAALNYFSPASLPDTAVPLNKPAVVAGWLSLATVLQFALAMVVGPVFLSDLLGPIFLYGSIGTGAAGFCFGISGLRRARTLGSSRYRFRAQVAIGLGIIGALLMGIVSIAAWQMHKTYGAGGNVAVHRCREGMDRIYETLAEYAKSGSGSLPPSLTGVVAPSDICIWVQWSAPSIPASGTPSPAPLPYVYLAANLKLETLPSDFVILHEQLTNHDGEGAHFLFADGKVVWLEKNEAAALIQLLKSGTNPPPASATQAKR